MQLVDSCIHLMYTAMYKNQPFTTPIFRYFPWSPSMYIQTANLFKEDVALLKHLKSSEINVFLTLLMLSDQVEETEHERVREIYTTQKHISEFLGLCNRTIHKAVANLKSLSILSIEKRAWNTGQSSIYKLVVPKDAMFLSNKKN